MSINTTPVTLVTGANGFSGRHLVSYLSACGFEVNGLSLNDWPNSAIRHFNADIRDRSKLKIILNNLRPDFIFHLAALTVNGDYRDYHTVNVEGTFSILRTAQEACPDARVLITSSSAVYGGGTKSRVPIHERNPFAPTTAYAVSKIMQEMIAYQQFAENGSYLIRSRTFNLTGPGESDSFVTSAIARQIAEIEADVREPVLKVGNLETVRDFIDVRDAVRAYVMLVEVGKPGEVFNVCSGRGTEIHKLLETMLDLSKAKHITVKVDETRLQRADVPVQIGDCTSLSDRTGWKPIISLERTLSDVLDYWRQRVGKDI